MKVQKQVITVCDEADLDFMPGFTEKFEDKINEITITINYGFEIALFKKFQENEKVKARIKKFILKNADIEDVTFICDTLPF